MNPSRNVEAETEAGLPEFVKAEFEAFLECGILAHGFLRLTLARIGYILNKTVSNGPAENGERRRRKDC